MPLIKEIALNEMVPCLCSSMSKRDQTSLMHGNVFLNDFRKFFIIDGLLKLSFRCLNGCRFTKRDLIDNDSIVEHISMTSTFQPPLTILNLKLSITSDVFSRGTVVFHFFP